MQAAIRDRSRVSTIEISIVIILVTLITGSSLDELLPSLSKVLRVLAYGSILFFSLWRLSLVITAPVKFLTACNQRYRYFLLAVGFYFLGLVIGGIRGPDPLYSLWQTTSDAIVFLYAFTVFGVVEDDKNLIVKNILRVTAIWTGVLLLGSLIVYIGNLAGWWLINPYYHPDVGRLSMLLNGPFRHANHFAYILMIGALASAYLALLDEERILWKWALLTVLLCAGLALTFGRGAMLGMAIGLLIMITVRDRRVGLLATIAAIALAAYLVAGALSLVTVPSFIPKISFAGRAGLWDASIENLHQYGPLGVGSGQAESRDGVGIHNFFLEQYGEGGIITSIGVFLWLVVPLITYKRSVLNKNLKIAILATMAGVLVHGLFWNQFLNGLRFFTLVGVLLWTGFATTRPPDAESASAM